MRQIADFPTARPGPLLGTMAKNFAHKITVEQDESGAVMHFPGGTVTATIGEGALHLAIEAADADGFARAREILIGHMLRFAHREEPVAPVWRDA